MAEKAKREARGKSIAAQVANFDKLAGSQLVPVETVAGIIGLHKASVWSGVKRGALPAPIRIAGATRWRVSDLRAVLAGKAA
jgi:predicted DNA-binding transcriptional regulator AlpA